MKIKPKKIRLKRKRAAPIEEEFKAGDWIDDYHKGREIPFSELKDYVGELVVVDYSTQAHPWYKLAVIKEVRDEGDSCEDYVSYDDGSRRGGGVGRISRNFLERTDYPYPAYIWELNRKGGPQK